MLTLLFGQSRGFTVTGIFYCAKCQTRERVEWGIFVNGKFYCIDCAPHDYDEDEGEK